MIIFVFPTTPQDQLHCPPSRNGRIKKYQDPMVTKSRILSENEQGDFRGENVTTST